MVVAQDVLQFVPSNRGKGFIVLYQGCSYASMNSKTRWYCSKKAQGCKARLVTSEEGKLVGVLGSHNHDSPQLFRAAESDEETDFIRYYKMYRQSNPQRFEVRNEETEDSDPIERVTGILDSLIPTFKK